MKPGNKNSYKTLKSININGRNYKYYSLVEAEKNGLNEISKLPKSLKVLLENLLRYEDDISVTKEQIQAVKNWLKENMNVTDWIRLEIDILNYLVKVCDINFNQSNS